MYRADERFRRILRSVTDTKEAQQMRQYIQHGSVSTYDHCIRVAMLSYRINRKFQLGAEEESLIRGAFLHDFFLYDWHDPAYRHTLHGFRHPECALKNAERYYILDGKERNIIRSHMWPLTLFAIPMCREAAIVCFADKCCSLQESIWNRYKKQRTYI